MAENCDDPKTKSEAQSLVIHEHETFEFLISLVAWYHLLFAVITVSKIMQNKIVQLDAGTRERFKNRVGGLPVTAPRKAYRKPIDYHRHTYHHLCRKNTFQIQPINKIKHRPSHLLL